MKRTLIVGNWKMHLNVQQSSLLVHRLQQHTSLHRDVEVVLAPSMLTLQPVSREIDRRKFRLAAQDAYPVDEGGFTGAVSFAMLQELVHYALIGHSERRIYFNEGLELIRDKVQAAVRNGITPILCVGETQAERAAGHTKQVIHDQLTTAISNLTGEEVAGMVVAYEPVWAIKSFGGTEPAKPDDIHRAVQWIRQNIHELYGASVAEELRVIYGASVEPEFVSGILSIEGVDGLLPGSASLNYQQFSAIVEQAHVATLQKQHGGQ